MVKYEYEIKYVGPKKHIIVYQATDGVDVTIYTGAPTISGSDNMLINEAKLALEDNYPGISKDLLLRGANPSGPTQSGTQSESNQSVPTPITITQSAPPVVESLSTSDPISQPVSREETSGAGENVSKNTNVNTNVKLPGINNILKPGISLPPISINLGGSSKEEKEYIVKGLGTLPFVWYNGYQISYTDVSYMEIFTDENIPKLKLTFKDTAGIIKDKGFPLDDTRVRVFLNSRSKNLRSIYIEFKIISFKKINSQKYTLMGSISVNGLYTRKYSSYSSKTSNKALQNFCSSISLGFNTNVEDTNDEMTWLNPAKTGVEFIHEVLANSYISDTSYMTGFVDYYYNFNYIDVEKEIMRDNSNDKGIETSGISESDLGSDTAESILPLVLTTDKSVRNSSLFIDKSRVYNNSTGISIVKGYQQIVKSYDTKQKQYLAFGVDSITTTDNKHIILKGSPQDNTFFRENFTVLWSGKIDTDNSHKNYNYSITQNKQNLDDLCKIYCELELPNPNFNLYKFLKIKILFLEDSPTPSASAYLSRISGDWLITDIRFVYSSGAIKQVVQAVKRELGLSPDEYSSSNSGNDNQQQKSNPEAYENHENPKPEEVSTPTSATQSSPEKKKHSGKTKPILDACDYWKLDDKFIRKAILANCKKECGLTPKEEDIKSYKHTKNDRIREIFGKRVKTYPVGTWTLPFPYNPGGSISDSELDIIKSNPEHFAELIYGYQNKLGIGNDTPGDGWKYRGRGYIQLTGKSLYKFFGDYAKVDIISDPNILINDLDKSAIVAVGFIKHGLGSQTQFTNQKDANRAVTQVIGGKGLNLDQGYGSEILAKVDNYSSEFDNEV